MAAQKKPTRHGYCYRKPGRFSQSARATREDTPSRLRLRLFGIHWRALSLYQRAGSPFGDTDLGLLLWIEFGCGSYSN